jgi:hypothetical protein
VGGLRQSASDGLIITWRNLKRIPRIPELAIFAVLQSIMFVLLFAFVFGGAIPLPGGGNYREYLMPGIFARRSSSPRDRRSGWARTSTGPIDHHSLPWPLGDPHQAGADVVYNGGILIVLMLSGLLGLDVRTGFRRSSKGWACSSVRVRDVRIGTAGLRCRPWGGPAAVYRPVRSPSSRTSSCHRRPTVVAPAHRQWDPQHATASAARPVGQPNPYVDRLPVQHPVS